MSALHRRTTAILVAGALATSLAGCSLVSGAEGETMTSWGQAGLPAANLLAVTDLPAADWAQEQPQRTDDGSGDTGDVCVYDFGGMVPEGPTGGVAFTSDALATMVTESAGQAPDAAGVLTPILAQLEGCTGPAEAKDGASMTSRPSAITVPGAAVSGCRDADITLDGQPLVGTFCLAAVDDAFVMVAVMAVNPATALTADQISALAGTALAKANA